MLDINIQELIDRIEIELLGDEGYISKHPQYRRAVGDVLLLIQKMSDEQDRRYDQWYRAAIASGEIKTDA